MNETPDNQFSNEFNQALRALADADAQQEAGPQVEAALLRAFRQQHAEKAAPQPARGWKFSSFFLWQQPVWGYALAAAALLLVGFAWWSWRAAQTTPERKDFANVPSPTPAPAQLPVSEPAPLEVRQPESVQFVVHRKPSTRHAKARVIEAVSPTFVEEEIATEFFPLVTTNALPERGQLRRVQVPRSTLINFGLPVNAERIDVPINADLLVGEDGGARAIRFVQERFTQDPVVQVYGGRVYGGNHRPIPTSYRNPK